MQRAGYLLPATVTGELWLKGLYPGIPGLSCPLRTLTGVPCPTCFLTRATVAALTGDLSSSLQWHLFGPVVAGGLILWSAVALRQRRLFPLQPRSKALIGIGIALVAYWIVRLVLSYGFGFVGGLGFPAHG